MAFFPLVDGLLLLTNVFRDALCKLQALDRPLESTATSLTPLPIPLGKVKVKHSSPTTIVMHQSHVEDIMRPQSIGLRQRPMDFVELSFNFGPAHIASSSLWTCWTPSISTEQTECSNL